jgi:hypothetical protein
MRVSDCNKDQRRNDDGGDEDEERLEVFASDASVDERTMVVKPLYAATAHTTAVEMKKKL